MFSFKEIKEKMLNGREDRKTFTERHNAAIMSDRWMGRQIVCREKKNKR